MSQVAAWVVAAVGTIVFTTLLVVGHLGEASYSGLMVALGVVCIAVATLPRLSEFDLKNLRLTLRELTRVRDEVFAKEEQLQRASIGLARLIVTTSALGSVWGSDESHQNTKLLVNRLTTDVLSDLGVSQEVVSDVLKYQRQLEDMEGVADQAERDQRWGIIVDELKRDAESTL